MTLIIATLASVIFLYFIFAFLSLRICAICTAVSLTWLVLLLGYFLNWHDNVLLLGILMGSSVVGLMYKIEKYFKDKKLSNFWLVRILVLIFGYLSVYLFLTKEWDKLIFTAILALVLGFISLFFTKPEKETTSNHKFKKNLKNKLDHCCD